MSEKRYNPKEISLVSTPLYNASSWTAAGVATVGTDDWQPALNLWGGAEGNRNAIFFNQVRFTPTGKMNCIFSPQERIFLKRLTLYCNFADGLVDLTNTTFTPAGVQNDTAPEVPFATYTPATDFNVSNFMYTNVQANRILANNTVALGGTGAGDTGAWRFPFPGFGVPMDLSLFDARLLGLGANPYAVGTQNYPFVDLNQPNPQNTTYQAMVTDRGFYLSCWLGAVGQPVFSTINIQPAYQTKRVKIWAVLDVESTFVSTIAGPGGLT